MRLIDFVSFVVPCLVWSSSACQTTKPAKKIEPLQIEYVKPEPIPAASQGGAYPLPGDSPTRPLTQPEIDAMEFLGLPYGGVCLTVEKAKKVAELKLYAQDVHADALFNFQTGQASNKILAHQLAFADEQLQALHEKESSWWYQNKTTVGVAGGFILGSLVTVGIVYGLRPATQ